MKRGRTIVAEREKVISESERAEMRRQAKRKKTYSLLTLIAVVLIVVMVAAIVVRNLLNDAAERAKPVAEKYEPTVEIVDEGGAGYEQSMRVREYVGVLEQDFSDKGLKVTRALIPAGKTREIDVYLEGRNEFYKTNLDRGTAETVEDVVRMKKYLEENSIEAGYVDVRIEGKGYWR